jgi:mono/diheme cytochrome c family protein
MVKQIQHGFSFGIVPLLLAGFIFGAGEQVKTQKQVDFATDVYPIFKAHCFDCHGPQKQKAGLRLDSRTAALKGGESGKVIIPGNSKKSLLIQRVMGEEEPRMPMGLTALNSEQIASLKVWIDQGAVWPDKLEPRKHWAYLPPKSPPLPNVQNREWCKNSIDYFVLAKLEKTGLKPSPEASKEILLRRVTLDLIGLPPTLEELDAFLKDNSQNAYEKVVNRLLNSPHYGERQARTWIDLARYADTDGYEKDLRRTIWKYRDWVINAFNQDMPFDQFTIEQIAGDLLPNPTTEQLIATGFHRNTMLNLEGGVDQLEAHHNVVVDRVDTTATVWLGTTLACARCHDHKYDPLTQKEYYQMYAFFNNAQIYPRGNAQIGEEKWFEAEIQAPSPEQEKELEQLKHEVSELEKSYEEGSSWQVLQPESMQSSGGATLTLQEDRSILASGENPNNDTYTLTSRVDKTVTGIRIEVVPDEGLPEKGSGRSSSGNFILTKVILLVDGKPVPLKKAAADFVQNEYSTENLGGDGAKGWAIVPRVREPHQLILEPENPVSIDQPAMLQIVLEHSSKQWPKHTIGRFRLSVSNTPEPALRLSKVAEAKARLQSLQSQVPTTLVMRDKPANGVLTAHKLSRGEFLNKGELVEAGVPAVLNRFPTGKPRNRLGLAYWLVAPQNPLTARVMVNRIWEQYFGYGIVETSEDFGTRAGKPTHPQLLDWLATEFVRQKWSMKAIHRLIVTSATYRQSSRTTPALMAKDPKNMLYARGPRFRMEGEMIRDTALTVSGLLSRKIGGPSVFPYQPEGVWDIPYNGDRWEMSKGEDRYRRGLYIFWRRSAPYPMFINFDATSREFCTVRRTRTNTPLQALNLLNDPVFMDAARALANRIYASGGTTLQAKLTYGFRLCTARKPRPEEVNRLLILYRNLLQRYKEQPANVKVLVASGEGSAEKATWTVLANVLLNLDETLTKE